MSFSVKSRAIVGVPMGNIHQSPGSIEGCPTHWAHPYKFCPNCGVESKTIPLKPVFDPKFVSFAEESGFFDPDSFYEKLLNEDAGPLAIFQSSNPMGSYGPTYLGIAVGGEDFNSSLSSVLSAGDQVVAAAKEMGWEPQPPCLYVIQEIF